MEFLQWVQIALSLLLGSNVIIEIIKVRAARKAAKQKRVEDLEDRAMAKGDKNQMLEQRFDDFRKQQALENREIKQRLSSVEAAVGTQSEIISSGEYIAIRREALNYIKAGEIEAEDRVLLRERYTRYRGISKRTDLDDIMSEVDKLQPKKNYMEEI